MTKPLREKYYGQTIEEYIASRRAELEIDAVGVWQIEAGGSDWFGLPEEQLEDFMRKVIAALLAAGARPVTGRRSADGFHSWVPLDFGNTDGEILENALADWRKDRGSYGVWFAKPHLIE